MNIVTARNDKPVTHDTFAENMSKAVSSKVKAPP